MSDYTKTTDFAAKDGLASGNAAKAVVGTEVDDEFNNIATAVNSKYDSSDDNVANGICALDASALIAPAQIPQATTTAVGGGETATDVEADAMASTTTLLTPSNLASVFAQAAGNGITNTSGVLSISTNLSDIAALAVTDGNIIVGDGVNWVAESGATARASLGLTIGSDVQAYDADLSAIGALAKTDSNFIVGNGTTWVAESGATVRNSLDLGTADNVQFNQVNIGGTTATLSRNGTNTDQLDMEGDTIFSHEAGTYNSAKIHFSSTTEPTTEGNNGDIFLVY